MLDVSDATDIMDILLVIAALVSLSAPGLTSSCSRKIKELPSVREDHVCIAFDNLTDKNAGLTPYNPERGDISINVLNHSAGVAQVQFPLAASSKYDSYELTLYVLEGDMTDEECQNMDFGFLPHSTKYFDVFNCSEVLKSEEEAECSPSCSRMGVVNFAYVFSACYYVRLTPLRNGNKFPHVNSLRANIHTGYKKQTLWGVDTTCHHQCFPGKNGTWELRLTFLSDLIKQRILLELWLASVLCVFNDNDPTRLAAWVFNYTHTGELECESKVTSPTNPNNCSLLTNGHVECIFSNIKSGNYCVTLIASDPTRCNEASPIWTEDISGTLKRCISPYLFGCYEEEKTEPLPAKIPVNNNKDGIFITVGAFLSIGVVGAIVYLIARKHFKPRPVRMISVMDSVMSAVQPSNPQVLLLYAQDCKEFMQLMTTFRHLLTNVGHCKMLDCFDPDRAEEIAESPVDWIRRCVSSPEVKVVVVASNCAVAHQKALSKGISLDYKRPLPYCHLFRYGLQEVTYNHDYTNTFVVRFDENDLSYLTPYTRYVLPLHLQELLRSLNPSLDVSCVGECKDEQKFRDNHSEMMNFKRQNPDYVVHLMTKSVDEARA
ncbi:uncharacterized protein [Anabrus simplex]|uniref:uncharacterized protein isoform X2 n=1 Tax=Anabrus simplex TaxID=316456 RepID=UPI0035A2D279